MKTRLFTWLLLVFFTAFCLLSVEMKMSQRNLAEKTVRLHVVANSDSEADQAQKLRVRDCVLAQVGALTGSCKTALEAKSVIAAQLPQIQEAAQKVLEAEGSDYSVSVSLGYESFDTRDYEIFTLPAGMYPALRVRIGAAEGKNWWCVVFPSLCTAATGEMLEEYAQAGGFEDGETELITGGEEKYELRFKSYEWLQDFIAWLRQ